MGEDERRRFGANLRAARLAEGMTQQQLADAVGRDRSTINQIEGGKWNTSFDTLVALAFAVRRPLAELIGS